MSSRILLDKWNAEYENKKKKVKKRKVRTWSVKSKVKANISALWSLKDMLLCLSYFKHHSKLVIGILLN